MKKSSLTIVKNAAYPVAVTALMALVWYVAAVKTGNEFIVPSPRRALETFFALLGEAAFYKAVGGSLLRAVLSYVLSAAAALLFALLGSVFVPVRKFLSPVVSVLRTLPTMAVVLLVAIWAGSRAAPVIVALAVILPTLYSAFLAALDGVPRDAIDMARLDGAGRRVLITRFYVPLALPAAALPTASSLSLCVKLTVAAEILAGTARSLGMEMQRASLYFDTGRLMALTVVTVIVGLALEKSLFALLRLGYKRWT